MMNENIITIIIIFFFAKVANYAFESFKFNV